MKKIIAIGIIILAIILGILILIQNKNTIPPELRFSEIKFETIDFDFDLLEQGKPQTAIFSFKNTGKYPLLIHNVETSCGCTSSEWPRYLINPTKSEEIRVIYDAKKTGRFYKTIKVFCNTEAGVIELTIRGEVVSWE